MDRTRLRVHLGAAAFPAAVWLPPPSLPKPALDSSSSKEPGQSVAIVGKLANTGAKENKDQSPLRETRGHHFWGLSSSLSF